MQTLARLCMKQLGLREAPFMVGFSPAAVRHIRNRPGEVIQGREVSFFVTFLPGISSLAIPRKQRLCFLQRILSFFLRYMVVAIFVPGPWLAHEDVDISSTEDITGFFVYCRELAAAVANGVVSDLLLPCLPCS